MWRILFDSRLKVQLAAGFTLLIVLTSCVGAIALYGAGYRSAAETQLLDIDQRIAELSSNSHIDMISARKAEKDYLLRSSSLGFHEAHSRYMTQIRVHVADIRRNMDEIRQLTLDAELIGISKDIDETILEYEQNRLGLLSLIESYGNDDSGLAGEYRKKMDELTALVRSESSLALHALLLDMRAEEHNYLMSKSGRDATDVRNVLETLRSAFAERVLDGPKRKEMTAGAVECLSLFNRLVQLEREVEVKKATASAIHAVEPMLHRLRERAAEQSAQTRGALDRAVQVTLGLVIGATILAVALGFVIALLTWRGIAKEVQGALLRYANFADRVAQGDMEARLGGQKHGLLGGLSTNLNSMVARLQDASRDNQIMADSLRESHHVLEARVKERTAELVRTNEELDQERALAEAAKQTAEEANRFARSTLDALGAHLAILDERGVILATNRAWREFAVANAAQTEVGVGVSYLDICDGATGPYGEEAVVVAAGIRAVLGGVQKDFSLEYPCHSQSEKRWFVARVTRFAGDGPLRVVMSHENITAAKLADEERQKFVSLVENSIDFVGMATLSGEVIYTNPAASELVELDPALRRTASSITDYFTEAGKKTLGDVVLPSVKATGRWEGEMQFRNFRTGKPIEMNSSVFIVRHPESGEPLCMATVSRDVTERKHAEGALRLNVAAMEAAANGIAITDADGTLEWVNPAFTNITGYSAAEAIGQCLSALKSGIQTPALRELLWKTIRAGKVWRGDLVNKRKDGSVYDEELTITPVRTTTDKITHFVAIKQDITQRKQADEARRENEERLSSLMESIPNIVWMTRPDGWNTYCNHRWVEYTGLTLEESYGFAWTEAFHPDDRAAALETWKRAATTGAPYANESRLRGADGQYHWFINRGVPLLDRSGRILKWFGTCTDIDNQKRNAAELQEARIAAETANRAKSEFLAHMSHEIRTPMNGILGMTELVMDTALTQEQREYLALLKQSGHALLKIINDILDFSKIEAGKMSLELAAFRLRETVGKVTRILALRAHEKSLELALRVAPDVPDALFGDADRLRQIIINLLGNAIKFTERGEVVVRIQLESRTDDDVELHCSVADTGDGISPDKQQKLFQAFQQLDGSNTRRYGGTGLGLVISQRLVEMMGGRIWVKSEPGQGATFHFTIKLGLRQETAGPTSPPLGADELTDLSVLVVDDNATNRQILHELLQHWNMRSTPVPGAAAALRAIDEALQAGKSFRLMLVDARMPEMDGFALVEKIRQRPELKSAVIMLLTSSDQPEDRARCHQLGIDTYLVKPVQQEELREAILIALGKRLPPLESTGGETPQAAHQPAPRALRILLAEDQPVNQRLAVRMLEKRGHLTVVAQNGREALELCGREVFDLALMDMQMPEMDGFEATRSIRLQENNTSRHLPIIAMTAYAIKGDRERCLAAGCDDYLAKPIDSLSLYELVERWGSPDATAPGSFNGTLPPLKDAHDGEVWNKAGALARVDGDEAFLRELVALFLEACPTLFAQLEIAIHEHDAPAIGRAAHTLKGNLASLGAVSATDHARLLEEKTTAGEMNDHEQLLAEMQRRLDSFLETLKSFLAETDFSHSSEFVLAGDEMIAPAG